MLGYGVDHGVPQTRTLWVCRSLNGMTVGKDRQKRTEQNKGKYQKTAHLGGFSDYSKLIIKNSCQCCPTKLPTAVIVRHPVL